MQKVIFLKLNNKSNKLKNRQNKILFFQFLRLKTTQKKLENKRKIKA